MRNMLAIAIALLAVRAAAAQTTSALDALKAQAPQPAAAAPPVGSARDVAAPNPPAPVDPDLLLTRRLIHEYYDCSALEGVQITHRLRDLALARPANEELQLEIVKGMSGYIAHWGSALEGWAIDHAMQKIYFATSFDSVKRVAMRFL